MYFNSDHEIMLKKKLRDLIYEINNSMNRYGMFRNLDLTRGTETYVKPTYYDDGFEIVLDMDVVEQYADECDLSDLEAAKIIITHEIMHVLLDHFDKKYRKLNHELFNIAADCDVNSYLDMGGSSIRAKMFGLPDFLSVDTYYRILKKLSDEQKKQEQHVSVQISMNSGSSDIETNSNNQFNSSSEYSIVIGNNNQNNSKDNGNNKQNQDTNNEQNQEMNDSEDTSSDNENKETNNQNELENSDEKDNDNKEDTTNKEDEKKVNSADLQNKKDNEDTELSDQMKKRLEKSNCSPLHEKYTDEEAEKIEQIKEQFTIGNDHIQRAAKTASKSIERTLNKNNIKGLDELMHKLERKELTLGITPHGRKETYLKLNNRRKNGTIILPGKKLENSGVKKKFDTTLTVFIDMSGSTWNITETLQNVAYKFYKLGATIVYYDSSILDIIKPTERFRMMDSHGGTNIKDVLAEYLRTGAKLERAYVITDGEDNFYALEEVVPKYTIYHIDKKEIQEIYSDKNPCKEDQYWW